MESRAGVTWTAATGTAATVTPTAADRDSLVAVMVAAPGAIAVTKPVTSTTAMAASLVPQNTVRPVSGAPLRSSVAALSCTDAPTSRLGAVGVICTLATERATTVTSAVALRPSMLAAMRAVPVATAVTRPVAETVATALSLLDHCTERSDSSRRSTSRANACSACVAPSLSVNCSDDSVTAATGVSTGLGAVMSEMPLHPVSSGAMLSATLSHTARKTAPTLPRRPDTLSPGDHNTCRAGMMIPRAITQLPLDVPSPARGLAVGRGATRVCTGGIDG